MRDERLAWVAAACLPVGLFAPELGCANVAHDDVVVAHKDGGADLADFVSKGPSVVDGGNGGAPELGAPELGDLAQPGDGAVAQLSTCDIHKLRINELSTGGAGGATDEFVELFNPCAGTVALQGGSLVYRAATSSTDNFTLASFTTQTIAASGFFVVANTNFAGSADVKPFNSGGLASAGGAVALRDSSAAVVDSVGWGTATNAFVETSAGGAPSTSQSLARARDGVDNDDNATDFRVGTPTPGAGN